jgi:hypothetical protein
MNFSVTGALAVMANFTWYVAAAEAGSGASTRARTTTVAAATVRKILTIRPQ